MTRPIGSATSLDAYSPAQIATLVEDGGAAKARLPTLQMATLGVLARAFIAFGAMFFTLVVIGTDMGFGPTRVLGGVAFSLGLILVLIGGAIFSPGTI